MRYAKPALSFEEQADLLMRRGLIAYKAQLVKRLEATSYFRLSGYLHLFRVPGTDHYQQGTTLEQVWRRCLFDQRLRTLVLDAIEAIEVFTRTQLAYCFAHQYGPFAYDNPQNFPNLNPAMFQKWQDKLTEQVHRSRQAKEEFLVHFFHRYGDAHTLPPIWCLIELMDFGSTLTFYRGMDYRIKQQIAGKVGVPDTVFSSWLLTLNTVRNRCAHHLRLWNWTLGNPVKLPSVRKHPHWNIPSLPNDRLGVVLLFCRRLLNEISPGNQWTARMNLLFADFSEIPVNEMGLPTNWQQHPLWTS